MAPLNPDYEIKFLSLEKDLFVVIVIFKSLVNQVIMSPVQNVYMKMWVIKGACMSTFPFLIDYHLLFKYLNRKHDEAWKGVSFKFHTKYDNVLTH